jgi:two-component system, NarL family, nitrate/nitrite response regulator NarL
MNRIRIVLVDDQLLFRKGLKSLLSLRPIFEVVDEASNGKEAIDIARKLKPDIILMDIDMPEVNGLVATRIIKRELPQIKIVILTVFDYDAKLFEAVKSGASGYLLKNLEPDELFEMLEKIQQGEAAINGVLAAKILNEFSRLSQPDNIRSEKSHLTGRETEVLKCLVQGCDNNQIAQSLSISTNTVKTHLSNIMEKLHMHSRIETALYAVSEGLVDYHREPADVEPM